MSERTRSQWPPAGARGEGADSIASELASRIAAAPSAPGDALGWAAVAATLEQEASAAGPGAEPAQLLFEAGRIHEERLGDPSTALAFHRRALALDPALLPNLRACRRLAMDAGDDALAADALAAEASGTSDPSARADLLLMRARLLSGLGKEAEAREALALAAAAAPGGFALAEESARLAAAAADRAAIADAYVRCARTAADPRLSAHYLSAAAALLEEGLGEPDRAAALALEAFALSPADPMVRAAARRHAERLRRTDELAGILRAEAEGSAGRAAAHAWHALAQLEERLGRPEEAIAALERGREAAPGDLLVLSSLARLREALGAFADASDALEALAGAHLAHDERAHVHEAIIAKLHRAELEEGPLDRVHVALQLCREVLALDPGNRSALSALGRLCARLGDWDGLLAAFEAEARAASDPREKAQRTFKAAEILEERLGRVDDALARYREALALDPELVPARSALERVCESEGRWKELCELLEENVPEPSPPGDRVAHLFRIARVREERLGDLAGAAATYGRILDAEPESRVALAALEAVLERQGRFDALQALLARDAAAAGHPRRRLALLQRRAEIVEEHLEDPEVARAAWEDVRAVGPRHLPALRALGRLHARAGRWEDLAAMYRAEADAAIDASTAADLVYRIGELLEHRLGRPDDAIAAYREATTLAPAHAPALQAMARLCRACGADEMLVEALRGQAAARTSAGERVAALLDAARVAEERLGDTASAIESYEEALRVDPGFAPALQALDRLYAQTGRAAALGALRRTPGEESDSERAERLLRLARLEADRTGDTAAALRATAELLAAAPDHPAGLLLELRLATDSGRRARARATLADAAREPETRAALLSAAALEQRPPSRRRELLARAAALAPESAALVPEEERRLRAAGDDAALARFCEARREAAEDLPSRASWSVRAGEAWERAGEPDRAAACFQAALAVSPALGGARSLLARRGTYAAVQRPDPAAPGVAPESSAAHVPESPAAVAPERPAAHVPESPAARAPERAGALVPESSAAVLPESPAALARLARTLAAKGRTAEAASALRRLVDAHDLPPGALPEHLLELAELEERLGDVPAAATALRRALAVDRGADAVHRRLIALEERSGDVARRLECLEAAATDARDATLRAEAHAAAGRLLADDLGAPERAVPHLRGALEIDPERAECRAALARVLEAVSPQDAVAEHRRLLAKDPLRAASWTALYRHFERSRAHDRAYVAATVLRWLGAPVPGPGAERLLLEGTRQALATAPPLSDEDLALLRAPGDAWPLSGVIESAGDAIAASIAATSDRAEPRQALRDHPLRAEMAGAAKTFAAPPWELYAGTAGSIDVEPAMPYAVLVGADLARRATAREQRFLLGRAAVRLRTRSCLAEVLPLDELGRWVAAALRAAVPGYAAAQPVDEERVRRVAKGIPRRARKAFEEAARMLAIAPGPPDLAAWKEAAAATADRAGLVLCGELPIAAGMLLREGPVRAPQGLAALNRAATRPDVLALVAFAASEAHFILRQRLRVAIA